MKTDRTILELLILLRENVEEYWDKYSPSGLCLCISFLYSEGLITNWEQKIIFNHIVANRPVKDIGSSSYWWSKFELPPRIEFLDKLIKQEQDENSRRNT